MPKQILQVPSAPSPVGPYSVATEAHGFVFFSGQVGIDPSTGKVADGGVAAEARQIMANLTAMLGDAGLTPADVIKSTIFLTDMGDFATVNEIYGAVFGGANPARSTVEVAALPLGVNVEIEIVAAR